MKPYQRAQRVGGQIQRELSFLLKKDISDPRLATATITGVKVTRDLRIARIYFSCYQGPAGSQSILDGFCRARGFVKRELARRLGLRYMPELEFYYDESFDYGDRIERLLRQLGTEPDGTDR